MIEYETGDIITTTIDYLAQGVATGSQEGLGTGLAKKISSRWPDARRDFKRFTFNHKFEGGDIFVSLPNETRPGIIYIATQPDMYHATIPFLRRGLKRLRDYCRKKEIQSVSIPKIGSGLGKLNWTREVEPLVIEYLKDIETRVVVYRDFTIEQEESS